MSWRESWVLVMYWKFQSSCNNHKVSYCTSSFAIMYMRPYNQVSLSLDSWVGDRKSYDSRQICVVMSCCSHIWAIVYDVIVIIQPCTYIVLNTIGHGHVGERVLVSSIYWWGMSQSFIWIGGCLFSHVLCINDIVLSQSLGSWGVTFN